MSITLVAKKAGVSSSTVSRVINNHPRVAPETVRTVRRVMADMGYTPSERRPGPKPQVRNQSPARHIAFLKFTTRQQASPGFELLLRGVANAARRENLTLTLHDLPAAAEFPRKLFDAPITGYLVHGAIPSPELRRMIGATPTVWIMGNSQRPDWGDHVMPDMLDIGRLAALYLGGRGHRQVAFANVDAGHWPFRLYWQAFAATAEETGMQAARLLPPRHLARQAGSPYSQGAVDGLVESFLALAPRPTGLYVADDYQTAMIQPALIAAGVKVGPDGLDVISTNNEEAYLMGLSPKPASIDIRLELVGRRAVEQLLWRVDYPSYEDRVISLVEPRLPAAQAAELPAEHEAVLAAAL
jgi:LacI family transcriptional regulator